MRRLSNVTFLWAYGSIYNQLSIRAQPRIPSFGLRSFLSVYSPFHFRGEFLLIETTFAMGTFCKTVGSYFK